MFSPNFSQILFNSTLKIPCLFRAGNLPKDNRYAVFTLLYLPLPCKIQKAGNFVIFHQRLLLPILSYLYLSPVAFCDRTLILYKPRKQAPLRLVFYNCRLQKETKTSLLRASITKSLRSRCRRWKTLFVHSTFSGKFLYI